MYTKYRNQKPIDLIDYAILAVSLVILVALLCLMGL